MLLYLSWTGMTNGIGTVAAIISTIGTGYFVQWLGSFQAFLTLTAVLYFSATVYYNLYATGDLIFDWDSFITVSFWRLDYNINPSLVRGGVN